MSIHRTQYVAALISQLREDALLDLREENKLYDSLRCEQVELSQMELSILESLPEKTKELFECIAELRMKIGLIEYDHLYMQGYRDCISMLKYLNIL